MEVGALKQGIKVYILAKAQVGTNKNNSLWDLKKEIQKEYKLDKIWIVLFQTENFYMACYISIQTTIFLHNYIFT